MKEEIKGEIRSEINDFKQIMEREQQELKSSIQFISDQYDSLKTSQQTNEEKCVTLKNENICMKGMISNLLNKIDEPEQYSRRNCPLINGIKEADPPPGGGALEFSVTGLCPSKTFLSPNEGIFRVNRHPIGEFFIGNDTQ